jgi:hypothetical protein
MKMQATAMSLLGMLKTAATVTGAPLSDKMQPHFATTMAEAGVPSIAPHSETASSPNPATLSEVPHALTIDITPTQSTPVAKQKITEPHSQEESALPTPETELPNPSVEQARVATPKPVSVAPAPLQTKPIPEAPEPPMQNVASSAPRNQPVPPAVAQEPATREPATQEPPAKAPAKKIATEAKPLRSAKETKVPLPQSTAPELPPTQATTPIVMQPIPLATQTLPAPTPPVTQPTASLTVPSPKAKTTSPASQPISIEAKSPSSEAAPTDLPTPEAFTSVPTEQMKPSVPTDESLPITPVQTSRKIITEAPRSTPRFTPQKQLHEAPALTSSTMLQSPASVPQTPPPHSVPNPTPSTQNMAATLPAPIPNAPSTPQETAHPKAVPPAVTEAATQPLTSPSSTLAHTTLQASPTVLEVGVPSGSHGWLKIRAEIDSTGAVQASLSPATHAAHETLHRDLPALTSFLAGEQVAVQLHITEAPQALATGTATDHDFTQNAATSGQGGDDRGDRSNPEAPVPADALETEWTTTAYAPAIRNGGSWLNVVA